MSAEKERRYQELYKNRFVNPIDQGIGRRTGWVLNKEVRKDSEGFDLFDDYWSDSGDESIDDLSLHANKENNGRPYKLSSPITHMPDFTPSSRNGSTDVEPLSDVGSKTVTSNGTVAKASNMSGESVKTKGDEPAAEIGDGVAGKNESATAPAATPSRDDGGIQDSDITGSIIKGGSSFLAPNSALQEFKTKTRLSFGDEVQNVATRSMQRTSSGAMEAQEPSDECSTSAATLKGSLTDRDLEEHSAPQADDTETPSSAAKQGPSSQEDLRTSAVTQTALPETKERISLPAEEPIQSEPEKIPDKEQSKTEAIQDKETTAAKDTEAQTQKSARKGTSRKRSASQKQPMTTSLQEPGATSKPSRRRRRNVTHLEEDVLMPGEEGMFISLQKSFASRQDGRREASPDRNILSDQSFQDDYGEALVDIVNDEHSHYKSTKKTKRKSRKTANSSVKKSVKKDKASAKTKRGKGKEADKPVQDFIDIITDSEDAQSRPVSPPTRSRKCSRLTRSKSQPDAESSSDAATTGSALTAKKPSRSRARASNKDRQSAAIAGGTDETGSTETDESKGQRKRRRRKSPTVSAGGLREESTKGSRDVTEAIDESKANSKTSRTQGRAKRGAKRSLSQDKSAQETEDEPVGEEHNLEEVDHRASPGDAMYQGQIPPGLKPATAVKSARAKRSSVHFGSIEVAPDDDPNIPGDGREDTVLPPNPESMSSQLPSSMDVTEVEGSQKKKYKATPGVKLFANRRASRGSRGGEEQPSEGAQKRTLDSGGEAAAEGGPESKKQRVVLSSVRKGKKRGGKRKLYSGDLPSSFLSDPSLVASSSAAVAANHDPSVASDRESSRSQAAPRGASVRGRARGRGRGKAKVRGSAKKTAANKEATQATEEPEDVVLDFLTKYESGKESESTDTEEAPAPMVLVETSDDETTGASSSAASTPGGLFTSVYPEPTPRSILKGAGGARDARKKNLTLKFFEVPLRKAIIVSPDKPDNGQRRTKRNRVRPVEFWRNERAEYERRKSGGFVLVGVQSPVTTSPEPPTRRKGKRGKGSKAIPQTPVDLSMHVSPPPGGKVAEHPAMIVVNPDTQEEVEVDTLRTAKMNSFVGPSGQPASVDDPITLCKSITQKAFSSGILTIRPLCEKGLQFVERDTMVFYITRGKVSVTIHHTTSILQNGDMFFVPQGNIYNIKNLRRDEAKLVFFQHKGR